MLGFNRRLDRIQGRRTVFVVGNPIIKTLCATVGFSDVTSANIVGYSNKDLRGNGQLASAVFENVGVAKTIKVSELKITGYEEAYAGSGFDCMLTFTRMDEFGRTMEDPELHGADACMFYFSATWDGENGKWNDPVWYDLDGNEVTDRTAKLLSGEGVWCNAPESIAGETLTLDFPSPLNTKVVDED